MKISCILIKNYVISFVHLTETTREKEGQVLPYVESDNINGLALTERQEIVTVYRSLQPAAAAWREK